MKIKIRSRYREVLALTGRIFVNGRMHPQYRQFFQRHIKDHHGEAYMTPKEAKFLVESEQNRKAVEAGLEAEYSYPAGYPMPVADDLDGPLHPPLTERNFHVSDPRQIDQAVNYLAEQAASITLAKAQLDAEARGDDPNDVEIAGPSALAPENAAARRARAKADREAARAFAG